MSSPAPNALLLLELVCGFSLGWHTERLDASHSGLFVAAVFTVPVTLSGLAAAWNLRDRDKTVCEADRFLLLSRLPLWVGFLIGLFLRT